MPVEGEIKNIRIMMLLNEQSDLIVYQEILEQILTFQKSYEVKENDR